MENLLKKAVEPQKKRKLVSFVGFEAKFETRFAGCRTHIAKDESEIVPVVKLFSEMKEKRAI